MSRGAPAPPSRGRPRPAPARSVRRPRPRATQVLVSLLALAALVGFVGGVPVLLWAWRGWPLPTTFEPGRWWGLLLAGYIHPDVLPNTIAAAAWLLWAWLALCLAWETVNQATAHRPRHPDPAATRQSSAAAQARPAKGQRPPVSGRPASSRGGRAVRSGRRAQAPAPRAVRRGAARWVATASVVITLLSGRAALAATPTTPPAGAQTIAAATASSAPTDPASPAVDAYFTWSPNPPPIVATMTSSPDPPSTTSLQPTAPRWTVQPGQSLWSIAVDAYPRATLTQLPTLVDRIFTTNYGTPDPAGRRLLHPELINPGMVLTLPTVTLTAPSATTPNAPKQLPTGDQPPGPPATDAPAGMPPPTGGAPATPPATAAPASQPAGAPTTVPSASAPDSPAPSPPAPTPPALPRPTPTTGVPPARPVTDAPNGPFRLGTGLAIALSGGLLAAAIVASVAARRRRRDATVTVDTAPPPPTPESAAVHTALLASTSLQPAARLDHALRALAALHTHPGGGGPLPQVLLARPSGTLDVFLRDAIPDPPAPWEAEAHGQIWTLPADATLPTVDLGLPPPCPALVQLGTQPDDAAVYVDLEALGTLALDPADHGSDRLPGLARALLAGLALSPLAAAPIIRSHGVPAGGLAAEDRIHPAGDLDDLLVATAADVAQLRADLNATGADTTFAARATIPTDNWDPTITLVATPPTSDTETDQLSDLALLAVPGGGLAVVQPAHPAVPADWRLTLLDGPTSSGALAGERNSWSSPPAAYPDAGGAFLDDSGLDDDQANSTDGTLVGNGSAGGRGHGGMDWHAVDPWWAPGSVTPRWRLDPLGLVLTPTTLAAAELAALCDLLADAARPPIPARPPFPPPGETDTDSPPSGPEPSRPEPWTPVIPPPAEPADPPSAGYGQAATPSPNGHTAPQPPTYQEPDWQVMIHLYGPPTVTSRTGTPPAPELSRERTLEVLAWLTTHRAQTRDALETALWNSRLAPRSLNNQLSIVRRLLVQLAGDHARAWLPTGRAVLRLDPAVTTDHTLLDHRLTWALAHRTHPDAAIPVLTDALDLVTGTPATYPWLEAELGSALTTTAIRAAMLLAELHLARDDPDQALAVTLHGLAIYPAHPGLFALRLRAHAAADDPAAVTAEYHAYLRAEQADPDWNGDTDPDLAHLHRHLTTRRKGTPAPTGRATR